MFVVWEQIPKENEGPLLQVKVISTLKQCMEGISPSFEKEMGVSVDLTYSADDKIVERSYPLMKKTLRSIFIFFRSLTT